MDRRTVLALVLVAAVILLTPRLFQPPPRLPVIPADSGMIAESAAVQPVPVAPAAPQSTVSAPPSSQSEIPTRVPAETVAVSDSTATFRFTNRGAALVDVELGQFRSLGATSGPVRLGSRGAPLVRFQGIIGRDTIAFDSATFRFAGRERVGRAERLGFEGVVGSDTLRVDYLVQPDSFLVRIDAQVRGRLMSSGGYMLLQFAPTLDSYEADSIDNQRNLAFVYEVGARGSKGTGFGKLDPGERLVVPGPLTWVALKSKYFIAGVLARDSVSPIAELTITGLARSSSVATHAQGSVVLQPRLGAFSLDLYAGPQQSNRLRALGRGFENSNPYGGFLQPVVQPFAGVVLRVLLWMRYTFDLGYGWVLVIFGVAVRLILWPLNHKAMRTSLKMQRIQPELNALQQKYKSDPQKLQSEMMKVYKDHDMSPFSMFSGCLPLLIPMPILFALFFVFQSTIEFRGVSFMWLADISQKDPYYILPLVMGVSMFVLSWIGMRNAPPNPQTKMMGYVFPVMMTFLLANLAAGLNLYYAVQNVAALPQQWLIASERARAATAKKT
ncbi:MAG TPA: YidC/Oxa1 family insertase periplasmic-domain containing protein [Gemmatimonadaceae bacterium]